MGTNRQGAAKRPLVRFISGIRPHLRYLAGAAAMGIGKFTLPLAFPLAFKYVVDVLLVSHPKLDGLDRIIDHWCSHLSVLLGFGGGSESKLSTLCITMLALYAMQTVASYFRNYWAGVAGNRITFDLRCKLFEHLQRLPHSFFDRNPAGTIVSRVLHDVLQANELVSSTLVDVWMDAVSLVLVIVTLFLLDWRLALVALSITPVWVSFMRRYGPKVKAVSVQMQEALAQMDGAVYERVVGATTIKSFCREEHEIEQFREQGQDLFALTLDKAKIAARQEALIQLLTRTAPMAVVWVGALLIMNGSLTLGTMLAFFTLIGFLYLPLERFAQMSIVVSASLAAIDRIFEFLDMQPEVVDHPLSRPFKLRQGCIQFEQVRFGYAPRAGGKMREVIRGIDLYIPGGLRVALVGRSGAGKTTLANLIPRFYDVSGGRVLIDGKDVRHFTLESLRQNISLVAQDALLFSASIADNLRYAKPDASDEMLWQAIDSANLLEWAKALPAGMATIIGERGVKMSGGQRQRLALARAFLKDAPIVILDEATSSVDSASENLIHEAMERLNAGRTVVLIAHRLRSAVNSDLIVVLDHGLVAEVGTHFELLRRGGAYARLYHEQARGIGALAGYEIEDKRENRTELIGAL
jgi:ATP-binding cassette, subfamily B, putative efflux pump